MKPMQLDLTPNLPNALPATGNSISAPAYADDPAAKQLVESCLATIVWRPEGGGAVEALRVPTAAERRELEQRRARLQVIARAAGLSDADKRKAGAAIAEMLDGFTRGRNLAAAAKQAMVAGFVLDLQALPAWAIERACTRIRRGEVEGMSLNWMPTSPFLYQTATAELVPLRLEEQRIKEVLALQPRGAQCEEERSRVAEKFAELRNTLHARAAEDRVQHDENASKRAMADNAARIEAEWSRQGVTAPTIGGMPISPALAERLGVMPGQQG